MVQQETANPSSSGRSGHQRSSSVPRPPQLARLIANPYISGDVFAERGSVARDPICRDPDEPLQAPAPVDEFSRFGPTPNIPAMVLIEPNHYVAGQEPAK